MSQHEESTADISRFSHQRNQAAAMLRKQRQLIFKSAVQTGIKIFLKKNKRGLSENKVSYPLLTF